MTRAIDAGVFIPVGNHGWIHSVNSPAVEDGSFQRVLEVTKGAEAWVSTSCSAPASGADARVHRNTGCVHWNR